MVEHSGADAATVTVKKLDGHSPLISIVEVAVRDEGTGFDVSKVNQEYHDTTPSGLATVKHLVESRGGSFALESQPGRGTTATIRVVEVSYKKP